MNNLKQQDPKWVPLLQKSLNHLPAWHGDCKCPSDSREIFPCTKALILGAKQVIRSLLTACCSLIQQGFSLRAEKTAALGLAFPSEPPWARRTDKYKLQNALRGRQSYRDLLSRTFSIMCFKMFRSLKCWWICFPRQAFCLRVPGELYGSVLLLAPPPQSLILKSARQEWNR